jgi:MraZ protein
VENGGGGLRTGDFRITLDDKGRVIFPSKLRADFSDEALIITRGIESCLWLFTVDEWESWSNEIMQSSSPFNAQNRLVLRRFIAPSQRIEFDKNDRLSIPQSLREYARLTKDCVMLGVVNYIELWDAAAYQEYLEMSESSFLEATEGFGNIHFNRQASGAGRGAV